ncbi:MAG TPA: hypothetical protein VKE74_27490 [Gemmataceae bacterium]|nr:hypothetical protein [Gemmataceae bacterium]
MRSASRIPGLAMMAAGFLLLLGSTRADEKPVVVKIGGLKATAPAEWKSEKPKYTLRSYQFKLPGKDGTDAELTVYPESNPNPEKSFPRWKATFNPPEGKTVEDISQVRTFEIPGAKVTLLDVSGTWRFKEAPQDPKSKEMILEDYRVVWVIVAEKEEATHLRLSGPKATVDRHYPAFEKWLKSLK